MRKELICTCGHHESDHHIGERWCYACRATIVEPRERFAFDRIAELSEYKWPGVHGRCTHFVNDPQHATCATCDAGRLEYNGAYGIYCRVREIPCYTTETCPQWRVRVKNHDEV